LGALCISIHGLNPRRRPPNLERENLPGISRIWKILSSGTPYLGASNHPETAREASACVFSLYNRRDLLQIPPVFDHAAQYTILVASEKVIGAEGHPWKVGGGMAKPEDEAGGPEAHRMAYWGAVAGGAITIIGGLLLTMYGFMLAFAFLTPPHDSLIPLSAAVFSGSALSIIGGFDAIAPKNYLRALVGSAMPAAVFLGSVMTMYAQGYHDWTLPLLPGIMGISGFSLVAFSRGAFLDGSSNHRIEIEEGWKKRLVRSFWGGWGLVILIISMIVVAKLVPASNSELLCLLIPGLIGLLCFLGYILWLKFLYWMKRGE
jgi:hypothetical protein